MKARIEKKLSKRLVQIAPKLFKDAWICPDQSELSEEQGSSVTHTYHVGGGVDYWGEGLDAYSAWAWWRDNWHWHGPFPSYPEGHKFWGYPDTKGFRATTRNLLRLAAEGEA